MDIFTLIAAIMALLGLLGKLVLYLIRRKRNAVIKRQLESNDNPYKGLRDVALNVSPKDLGLDLPDDPPMVFGIVMDIGMKDGIVTIVAFETGDASMYTSTGGGMIGGRKHGNISAAAKQFVDLAQKHVNKASIFDITDLPGRGVVLFHLLTNDGIYAAQEEIRNIEKKASWLAELFFAGNDLITQLRLNDRVA